MRVGSLKIRMKITRIQLYLFIVRKSIKSMLINIFSMLIASSEILVFFLRIIMTAIGCWWSEKHKKKLVKEISLQKIEKILNLDNNDRGEEEKSME